MTAYEIIIFFFQAEDGIRYLTVTGVQTCALPISRRRPVLGSVGTGRRRARRPRAGGRHGGPGQPRQIGRASCRGRAEISVVAGSLKKKSVDLRGSRIIKKRHAR